LNINNPGTTEGAFEANSRTRSLIKKLHYWMHFKFVAPSPFVAPLLLRSPNGVVIAAPT